MRSISFTGHRKMTEDTESIAQRLVRMAIKKKIKIANLFNERFL